MSASLAILRLEFLPDIGSCHKRFLQIDLDLHTDLACFPQSRDLAWRLADTGKSYSGFISYTQAGVFQRYTAACPTSYLPVLSSKQSVQIFSFFQLKSSRTYESFEADYFTPSPTGLHRLLKIRSQVIHALTLSPEVQNWLIWRSSREGRNHGARADPISCFYRTKGKDVVYADDRRHVVIGRSETCSYRLLSA